jgi:osmoprotectant transport system substrate-binding protein
MRLAKQFGGIALALVLSGALAACGSSKKSTTPTTTTATPAKSGPGVGKPPITIGDKNFTEEFILGDLYAQALQAKGFTVVLKPNIGSTEITDKALTSGQIQMYPEYTGILLSAIAGRPKPPATASQSYAQAKAFERARGFTLLKPTPFADSDVLVTLKPFAQKHHLTSIADLKKLGKKAVVIGAPEFRTRYEGLVGLHQAYGVFPTFKPLSIGLTYTAIDSGQANVADAFTTDPQLSSGKYVQLKDPKFIFGFQNVAPVVSRKALAKEGSGFARVVDAVSAKLTLPAIVAMNTAVGVDKQDPASVAHRFLADNGLL